MRSGVFTVISIEDSAHSSSWLKSIEQMITDINVRIVNFAHLSKSIKYLKQVKSYERVIIDNESNLRKELFIAHIDFSRLSNYRQIHSILIVCHTLTTSHKNLIDMFKNVDKDLSPKSRSLFRLFINISSATIIG